MCSLFASDNADVPCRVRPRHVEDDTGGGKRKGGVGAVAVRHARGGAHPKHGARVRDAGHVEVQRLVERRRGLPSHNGADRGRYPGQEARGRGGGGGARSMHEGTGWTLGTAEAHVKHLAHVRDAGHVEAQRLVERRRVLPSHNGAHGRVTRGARGPRAWGGGGGARSVHRRPGRTMEQLHAPRAHPKHAAHGRGAGRVEVQRLVERRRGLPSHSRAHRGRYPGREV